MFYPRGVRIVPASCLSFAGLEQQDDWGHSGMHWMNVKRLLNHKRRGESKHTITTFLETLSRGIERFEGNPAPPLCIALWCGEAVFAALGFQSSSSAC